PDSTRTGSAGPPVRWWPVLAVLAIGTGLLSYIWLRQAPSAQDRVVPSFPVLFFTVVALFLWLVLFSRLPGRRRWRIFLAVALLVGAGFLLLEIQGVSGNLVPVVGFRWAGEPDYASASGGSVGVSAPGPEDYPQFYGPNRDATLAGPRLARDWRVSPPRELWRRPVGEGWSSFAVVGDAAVTQEQRGEQELVVRYELASGRQVWAHADEAPFDTTVGGSGPRATPTIVDGRVYTLGATGILNCLELATGGVIWSRNVLADNGGAAPDWGMASSPLVVGEVVVVQLGRRSISLAAYDRASGEPVWRVSRDSGSYSTPTTAVVAGRRQLLIVNQISVAGHDPADGAPLWREEWSEPGERVTPPLRVADDLLLVSAGYGVGSRLLRVVPAGDAYSVAEVWRSPRLKSKFASMVLHGGTVYGLDDGVLTALDPATGERLWKRGRYGHGQLLLVADLLLIQAENGEVALVDPDPDEHLELARFVALDGKTWNPPALSGRRLLVRNNREAACYELATEDS
ncbi:MAG: PQQ-binding-like beta-propeller repeat protein, partial [Thermoanaerobaculia bacterium]